MKDELVGKIITDFNNEKYLKSIYNDQHDSLNKKNCPLRNLIT